MKTDEHRSRAASVPDFTDEQRARAASFARRRYRRFALRQALYALAFVGVYVSGLSRSMSTSGVGTGVVWNVAAVSLAIGWALTIPVAFAGARDERAQGLSQGWRRFPVRSLVWGLLLIVAVPSWMQQAWEVALHGYGLLEGSLVWFPVAVLVAPLIVTATARKVDDEATAARLRSVIRRSGVRIDGVRLHKVMQGTRRQNAYVIGVWPTRRLVVFDTLAAEGPVSLDAAVAHELGHMRLHHTVKRLAFFIGVFALVFVATAAAVQRLPTIRLFETATVASNLGLHTVQIPFIAPDPVYVPLVLLAWGALAIVLRPILVGFIRSQERAADLFGVRLTRDPTGFALLLRRLALSNLADLDPDLVARLLFATHGSIPDRIGWVRAEPLPDLREPPPPAAPARW